MVIEGAIEGTSRKNRNALIIFTILQALDFLTTMAVFRRGGIEGNPLVASLMPFTGPVVAVLMSKVFLVFLTWRLSRRPWIINFGNILYGIIVTWNLLMAVSTVH